MFGCLPIIARLVTPEDWGEYVAFSSVVALVSVPAYLAFDRAVMEVSDGAATAVMALVIVLTSGIAGSALLILYVFGTIDSWALAFAWPTILMSNIYETARYFGVRTHAFKSVGAAAFLANAGRGIVGAGLAAISAGPAALMIADLASRIGGISVLSLKYVGAGFRAIFEPERKFAAVFKSRWRGQVRLMISAWIDVWVFWIPPAVILAFYGASAAGQFAFALRMIGAATALAGRSVADTYHAGIGRSTAPLKYTCVLLLFIGALGTVGWAAALAFQQPLFNFMFGSAWSGAGFIFAALIPLMVMQIAFQMISRLMIRIRHESAVLVGSITLALTMVFALVWAKIIGLDYIQAISLMSFSGAFTLCAAVILAMILASRHYQRQRMSLPEPQSRSP